MNSSKKFCREKINCYICTHWKNQGKINRFGMWRSLVAYSSGGRGVASSNLVIPTFENEGVRWKSGSFFILRVKHGWNILLLNWLIYPSFSFKVCGCHPCSGIFCKVPSARFAFISLGSFVNTRLYIFGVTAVWTSSLFVVQNIAPWQLAFWGIW